MINKSVYKFKHTTHNTTQKTNNKRQTQKTNNKTGSGVGDMTNEVKSLLYTNSYQAVGKKSQQPNREVGKGMNGQITEKKFK